MELSKVLSKIQKCLALGASSNEHEAAAAMRQAQKLMAEYNVDPETVGQVVVEIARSTSTSCSKPPLWEQWLAVAIAKNFGCKVLLHRGWFDSFLNKNGSLAQYSFIGPRHQAMTSAWTMDLLLKRVASGRSAHIKSKSAETRAVIIAAGNTYAEAFVGALQSKIEVFAGNSPATDKAIILMLETQTGRTAEERDAAAATKPKLKRAKGSMEDYMAGRKAGEDTPLHRPIG